MTLILRGAVLNWQKGKALQIKNAIRVYFENIVRFEILCDDDDLDRQVEVFGALRFEVDIDVPEGMSYQEYVCRAIGAIHEANGGTCGVRFKAYDIEQYLVEYNEEDYLEYKAAKDIYEQTEEPVLSDLKLTIGNGTWHSATKLPRIQGDKRSQ